MYAKLVHLSTEGRGERGKKKLTSTVKGGGSVQNLCGGSHWSQWSQLRWLMVGTTKPVGSIVGWQWLKATIGLRSQRGQYSDGKGKGKEKTLTLPQR